MQDVETCHKAAAVKDVAHKADLDKRMAESVQTIQGLEKELALAHKVSHRYLRLTAVPLLC